MEKTLTDKEIKDISLGFQWNPDMSYEQFVKENGNLSYNSGHEMYDLINERYIAAKYN